MIPPASNISNEDIEAVQFAVYLRQMLIAANEAFGGLAWSLPSVYSVFGRYQAVMRQYVHINNPSPFKRCAGFALAFMDAKGYPLYGEFERHKFQKDIQHIPRHSGAVLVYEYVKLSLHGAKLTLDGGDTKTLSNPITVSKHTFVDLVHALAILSNNGSASFHLLALLFEQLAYQTNDASYEKIF